MIFTANLGLDQLGRDKLLKLYHDVETQRISVDHQVELALRCNMTAPNGPRGKPSSGDALLAQCEAVPLPTARRTLRTL
jgi:hypothetical protein